MSKTLFVPLQLSLGTVICLSTSPLLAQVTTDGTVNTQVNQNGNVAEITGGETRGSNLFHSFQDFSVGAGNEAFFDNAENISDIFSRVTGGNISNIDGLIRANGTANLFLINPAGIVFGENAQLNIGGSFYGSSASSILFEDGEFSAIDNLNQPILTINAPIGLSFRDEPGDIVNRSVAQNLDGETNVTGGAVGLQVADGETLALIGGNVLLDDGNLTAKGGHVEIGSIFGESEVAISQTDTKFVFDYDEVNSFGNITSQNTSIVDVTAQGNGSINITGGNLSVNNSSFFSGIAENSGSPEAQAGNIEIDISEAITLNNNSRVINQVRAGGIGNAGNVEINTDSLTANNASQITTLTEGTGNSGDVNINAEGRVSFSGRDETDSLPSAIFVGIEPSGNGNSGNINIQAESLELTDRAQLLSNVEGIGDAGDINIQVANEVNLVNSALISEITAPNENDNGGEGGRGNGGDINVTAGSVLLQDGSSFLADTENTGDAGSVNIQARDRVMLEGEGLSAFANSTDIVPSQISATVDPEARGNGGSININTSQLTVRDSGFIRASTFGQGDAGNLSVFANNIRIDGGLNVFSTGLFAQVGENATGQGGNISIEARDSVEIIDGAVISADSFGQGDAGNISLTTNRLFLTNESLIVSRVGSMGDGGNINLGSEQSPIEQLEITGTSVTSVSVFGQGNAGNLSIYADNLELKGTLSAIDANVQSNAAGQGGNLFIDVDRLAVTEGGQISASTLGDGNAGLANISANEIFLDGESTTGFNSGIFSTVEPSGFGNAGRIDIETTNLTISNGAEIDASTLGEGDGGNINIEADGTILLDGVGEIEDPNGLSSNSGIFAQVEENATGQGGNVDIASNNLIISNDAEINIGSESQGSGGSLFINTDSLSLDAGSILSSTGFGQGGNIELAIAENLTLDNSSLISAEALNNAVGGNIDINANFIIAFPNGNNDILANANQGQGGNITIDTESLLGIQERTPTNLTNDIDASSQVSGLDGTINITNPDINLIQGVVELPTNIVSPEQTTAQACANNRATAARNGLAIKGKGGVPPAPDLPLNSSNIVADSEANSTSAIPAPIETSYGKIQPARGIEVTESGEIRLVAYRTNDAGDRIPEIKPNCGSV